MPTTKRSTKRAAKVAKAAKPAAKRAAPRKQRKTLDLDQALIDEARAALGAETDTETVRLALERIVSNRRAADGLRRLAAMNLIDPSLIER